MAIMHIPDENHVVPAEKPDLLPAWVNPDLNRLMVVKKADGDFRSWAESLVDLPAGAMFARITGVSVVWPPSWSSVQAERNLHIELNSNLVFVNHSCAPTLEWDMATMEIRVSRNRDLKKGDFSSTQAQVCTLILLMPLFQMSAKSHQNSIYLTAAAPPTTPRNLLYHLPSTPITDSGFMNQNGEWRSHLTAGVVPASVLAVSRALPG
ncbi:hypothetical protein O1611_g882 [Lasiodiplodia mahajangana]|uniref:Uncharacterized protein n=1 Tax=Lasiodiplodia mahajangana TaxID=1108764 RepID=A0ACC2JYZ3_9PEZI|nr:hypothetical protein O1611_g882 [Lasiodiplodia mahajangana]